MHRHHKETTMRTIDEYNAHYHNKTGDDPAVRKASSAPFSPNAVGANTASTPTRASS